MRDDRDSSIAPSRYRHRVIALSRYRAIVIAPSHHRHRTIAPSLHRAIAPSRYRAIVIAPSHHRVIVIAPSRHRHRVIVIASSHHRPKSRWYDGAIVKCIALSGFHSYALVVVCCWYVTFLWNPDRAMHFTIAPSYHRLVGQWCDGAMTMTRWRDDDGAIARWSDGAMVRWRDDDSAMTIVRWRVVRWRWRDALARHRHRTIVPSLLRHRAIVIATSHPGFPQSLKSPWILGFPWKVLENEFVLEKSLNLGDLPWNFNW